MKLTAVLHYVVTLWLQTWMNVRLSSADVLRAASTPTGRSHAFVIRDINWAPTESPATVSRVSHLSRARARKTEEGGVSEDNGIGYGGRRMRV